MEKGHISVQTENIFPIIKQFLYSDQEIFLRELISNSVDATKKLETLASKGEFKGKMDDLTIEVEVDEDEKTISVIDKGVGMDEEEIKRYLNQVAFSSAQEFLEKYKDDSQIIGHFGLGFYSSFMVAEKVVVRSKSWKEDAPAVEWTCQGEPEYTIEEIDKEERGTEVVLHLNEDAEDFASETEVRSLLGKYCKFLPVPIQFGTRTITREEGEGEEKEEVKETVPDIVNDTHPAWKKNPNDLSEADYSQFYQKLYPNSTPPLFWIHLNIDYPFRLTGILYFPKLGNKFEVQQNNIQLYANQVYVTDNVQEIVPEFLTLLHGVIDSPDIPLNVSRSYLQSDRNVKKISGYITKKVAEKLEELYEEDREDFESKWDQMSVFFKYGMISEDKFYDKVKDFALFKNIDGEYFTMKEYLDKVQPEQTDKDETTVLLYTNDPEAHHTYVDSANNYGYDVLLMDQVIDNHYMQHLETKRQNISFARVDSDTMDNLIKKEEEKESVLSEDQQESVKALFEPITENLHGELELKALSPEDHPVVITKPEFMRRMKEMQQMQGVQAMADMPDQFKVVINTNNPLISKKLVRMRKESKKEDFAKYLIDLARLNQGMLKGESLSEFVNRSYRFID